MSFKLVIGDQDPWHLSWRPLALIAAGLIAFFGGGWQLIFGAAGWWWFVAIAGVAALIIGGLAAIREKLDLDAELALRNAIAEKKALDVQARDKGAV